MNEQRCNPCLGAARARHAGQVGQVAAGCLASFKWFPSPCPDTPTHTAALRRR